MLDAMDARARAAAALAAALGSALLLNQCGGDDPSTGFSPLGSAGAGLGGAGSGASGADGGSAATGQGAGAGSAGSEPTDAGMVTDGGVIGGDRPVPVHVPASYDPDEPTPLVMLLHGYGVDGPTQEAYLGFEQTADERGFIYAYPSGTRDMFSLPFWNATDACCDIGGSGVDDSGYLRTVIEQIQAALNIDPQRIYLVGHSNGAFMSYRMACDHADLIAAIAPLAGGTFEDTADCAPAEPVAVLHIHGTLDATIAYGGGLLFGTPFPGAEESARIWVGYNDCLDVADTSPPNIDLDAVLPGAETDVRRWQVSCDPGGYVELWKIQGGGHVPVFQSDFRDRVVDFFDAHPKP